MAKKPEGPFEIRGRLSDHADEIRLATVADQEAADESARNHQASGLYSTVTVIDSPTQTCVAHYGREEGTDAARVPYASD